jgi:hypothetical protein
MKAPVVVGRGGLFVRKIFGRPSRARKEGRTGHRWLRRDTEGEAVIIKGKPPAQPGDS